MKIHKKIGVFFLFSLVCSSCATFLKGSADRMTVESDPPGAEVMVNGEHKGATPTTFTVESNENLNIQITKEGYKSEDTYSPSSLQWGYEIPGILFAFLGVAVDLSDGAAWAHDDTTITAHLEPLVQASPVALTAPAAPHK